MGVHTRGGDAGRAWGQDRVGFLTRTMLPVVLKLTTLLT